MVTSSEHSHVGAEFIRRLANLFAITWRRVFIISGHRSIRLITIWTIPVKDYACPRIRSVVKWFYGGMLNFKTFPFSGRTHIFIC